MAERLIEHWQKNAREIVQVKLTEFNGASCLDVRCNYLDAGMMKPTRKGLTLRVEQIPLLLDALIKAESEARLLDLL